MIMKETTTGAFTTTPVTDEDFSINKEMIDQAARRFRQTIIEQTRASILGQPSMSLGGVRVYESNVIPKSMPKIKLKQDLLISDDVREKVNKYLEDTFGHEACVFKFQDGVVMHSELVAQIKRASELLARPY